MLDGVCTVKSVWHNHRTKMEGKSVRWWVSSPPRDSLLLASAQANSVCYTTPTALSKFYRGLPLVLCFMLGPARMAYVVRPASTSPFSSHFDACVHQKKTVKQTQPQALCRCVLRTLDVSCVKPLHSNFSILCLPPVKKKAKQTPNAARTLCRPA